MRLIEQWGTGISRIKEACHLANLPEPRFEEFGTSFRITLYSGSAPQVSQRIWELKLVEYLQIHNEISSSKAAELWEMSERGARMRLRILVEENIITRIASSPNDPNTVYILRSKI